MAKKPNEESDRLNETKNNSLTFSIRDWITYTYAVFAVGISLGGIYLNYSKVTTLDNNLTSLKEELYKLEIRLSERIGNNEKEIIKLQDNWDITSWKQRKDILLMGVYSRSIILISATLLCIFSCISFFTFNKLKKVEYGIQTFSDSVAKLNTATLIPLRTVKENSLTSRIFIDKKLNKYVIINDAPSLGFNLVGNNFEPGGLVDRGKIRYSFLQKDIDFTQDNTFFYYCQDKVNSDTTTVNVKDCWYQMFFKSVSFDFTIEGERNNAFSNATTNKDLILGCYLKATKFDWKKLIEKSPYSVIKPQYKISGFAVNNDTLIVDFRLEKILYPELKEIIPSVIVLFKIDTTQNPSDTLICDINVPVYNSVLSNKESEPETILTFKARYSDRFDTVRKIVLELNQLQRKRLIISANKQ